ncbi:hypothetical protein [Pseudoalteromonas sp. T1lg22]|uniref:hypothetical protein n=1 Tax=Pseudoalteromonas sp. T1lg22 TaxID=2077096 RepID=UPI001319EFBD|nr:hypothetical protein [Pseudoalteromonas sp. T1lg22]
MEGIEYSNFEKETLKAIKHCTGRVRQCCENAIKHLEKACILEGFDNEMAVFRGITAEEEAATALILCLKNHRYRNAEKLDFKKHLVKLGGSQFLEHLRKQLFSYLKVQDFPAELARLYFTEVNGRPALGLKLKLKNTGFDIIPKPPLNFSSFEKSSGQHIKYDATFKRFWAENDIDNALKYLKSIANERNKLLYADSSGKPCVEGHVDEYIVSQKDKVFRFLYLILLIDPWEKKEGKSKFVQQALDSYLLLLEKIDAHECAEMHQNLGSLT